MALDLAAAKLVARQDFADAFTTEYTDSTEADALAFADVILSIWDELFRALKEDADLTGVSSGGDTVPGGID